MKRLSMIMVCLLAMMTAGTGLKAQEVTIVLMPGYTWISIPTTDTLDFETALGSFTPAVGDMIKSRWGAATFRSDGQWRGSISEFYPGYGYHYYSNRTTPVFLTFNAQQPAPQLIVTTAEPTEITATSTMSGGSITSNDGSYIYVFMKGICWATHPNPMVMNDFFTESGNGLGSFTAEMTDLTPNTLYYVRAYAVTLEGTIYGEEVSFTTVASAVEPKYVYLLTTDNLYSSGSTELNVATVEEALQHQISNTYMVQENIANRLFEDPLSIVLNSEKTFGYGKKWVTAIVPVAYDSSPAVHLKDINNMEGWTLQDGTQVSGIKPYSSTDSTQYMIITKRAGDGGVAVKTIECNKQ